MIDGDANAANTDTSSSKLETNDHDPLRLLTTDEVAALLQVHPLTVRRAVANKKLRCIRLGRSTRFRREDVTKYVHQMSTTGTRASATSESAKQKHAPKRSSKK